MDPISALSIGSTALGAASDLLEKAKSLTGSKTGVSQKARETSENFEAVFLNTMFQQMFTSTEGEGPMGGKGSTGVWRSFLTDEYSKSFAKAGGIGLADQVYSALLAQQQVR